MGLFDALDASGSALSAERVRMDVTAENLANAQSTRTANGQGPYRRKEVILQEAGAGVGSRATFADSLQAARGVRDDPAHRLGRIRVLGDGRRRCAERNGERGDGELRQAIHASSSGAKYTLPERRR